MLDHFFKAENNTERILSPALLWIFGALAVCWQRWRCSGRISTFAKIFSEKEKFNQLQLINRPLVAGEDSGDQFAEIVDLLGPPQTDIMEAMGVEDAVRDILVFFYISSLDEFYARWRPLPWDWLALADEVQEETTGHSFWID